MRGSAFNWGGVGVPDYRGPTLAERIAANTQAWKEARGAGKRDEYGQALREVLQAKEAAAGALVTGRTNDADLRALAERRADMLAGRVDNLQHAMPAGALLLWLNAQVQPLQGRAFELQGDTPEADQLRGFIARARCPLWWRRQLRRAAVQLREAEGRAAGEICAVKRSPYVTHDTAARHAQRKASNAAMMAATELENDAGQVMSLADLAAASVSNKAIRRGELMTRITGCERWAEAFKMRGVFLTLTAPSRFHSMLRHGGRNPNHDGSTPKDAQQWLCKAWQRARAKLQRAGVGLFGFRVAEPHHDACPHWHALLWTAPGQLWRAVRIIKRAWLKLEGDEAGARAHRCKAVLMRPGGASGYIAKYIAKNIDDAGAVGTEGHRDDDAPDAMTASAQGDLFGGTAQRVEAWASAHGIRQFQAIGQPPVTVWRELRRITEQGGATPRLGRALDAVNREGDKRADWAAYVLEQGGMCAGRNYLLRVAMLDKLKHGRYETAERPCPIGVTDTTGPGDVQLSNRREWKPRGTWTTADQVRGPWAPRVSPWTRVNNCTRGGRLEAWTDRIKRENSGEFTTESPSYEPPRREPSRTTERLERLRHLRST